jgi:hypothetical protein
LRNKKGQAKSVNFLNVFYADDLSTMVSDGLLGLSPYPFTYGLNGEQVHLLVD